MRSRNIKPGYTIRKTGLDVKLQNKKFPPPNIGTACIAGAAVGGADLDTLSSGTSCLLPRDLSWKSSTVLESWNSPFVYLLPPAKPSKTWSG